MFSTTLIIIPMIFCTQISADVSHLKSSYENHFRNGFNGYNYNPPSHQLPSPAPHPPTTTTFRPEIIINKVRPSHTYLPPSTETPVVIHPPDDFDTGIYLPPLNEELPPPPSQTEPPQNYLPSENVPDNQYLPPADDETNDGYQYIKPKQSKYLRNSNVLHNTKSNALHISVNSLRCLEGNGGYFQANIGIQSLIENLPIIDLDTIDPRCQFDLIGVRLLLNIPNDDFQRCGITPCGNHELCVNLRFPHIFSMKSLDDSLLTLKCKIQQRSASRMHAFRFGVSQSGQARNAVVFAHGSSKQHLRTQLGLYRQSGSGFTKPLDSGSFVQLGEELLLRAQVKVGDGWNHSRVADVSLQRVGVNGEILNSATLIKSNGCINPQMKSVCSIPPVFEPPLGYRFGFRVVMFQGMKSGDEMIMSVRIIGCIDHHDCHLDHVNCADNQSHITSNRIRRQINITASDDKIPEPLVEISNISFRVVMPTDFQRDKLFSHATVKSNGEIALVVTVAVVCFLIIIVLIIVKQQADRKFFVWDKY